MKSIIHSRGSLYWCYMSLESAINFRHLNVLVVIDFFLYLLVVEVFIFHNCRILSDNRQICLIFGLLDLHKAVGL